MRRLLRRPQRLVTEVLAENIEWDRHVYAWTPQTLLTLLASNGFEYVDHCYESRVPESLAPLASDGSAVFRAQQILKVRKIAPAPAKLV